MNRPLARCGSPRETPRPRDSCLRRSTGCRAASPASAYGWFRQAPRGPISASCEREASTSRWRGFRAPSHRTTSTSRHFSTTPTGWSWAREAWTRRRRVALADLAGEPWLLASNRVVRELIAEAFAACGLPMPREAVTASSILLRNHLLATGRFVTVLPASVVRCNATRWSLKRLPIELAVKPRSVAMVTLRNRTSSPAAALFAEHLRAAARTIAPG